MRCRANEHGTGMGDCTVFSDLQVYGLVRRHESRSLLVVLNLTPRCGLL